MAIHAKTFLALLFLQKISAECLPHSAEICRYPVSKYSEQVKLAVHDSYKRLLSLSMGSIVQEVKSIPTPIISSNFIDDFFRTSGIVTLSAVR